MKSIYKLTGSILIFLLLTIINLSYAEKKAVFVSNIAELNGFLKSGKPFKIKVYIRQYSHDLQYVTGIRWGSTETMPPKTLITDISIVIEDKKTYIPLSAFCDLGNPREVFFTDSSQHLSLLINGGDAAGSYLAELTFEKYPISRKNISDYFIRRRKISHGEFPDESWEETKYSFKLFD
jgi:hypothetical protein